MKPASTQKQLRREWRKGTCLHLLSRLFTIILAAALALTVLMYRIFLGPSPAASRLMTLTLTETSALKFVPVIFLGQERVDGIVAESRVAPPSEEMDLSLISVPAPDAPSAPAAVRNTT